MPLYFCAFLCILLYEPFYPKSANLKINSILKRIFWKPLSSSSIMQMVLTGEEVTSGRFALNLRQVTREVLQVRYESSL